ncbi:MAG TPA: hypothetical protein VL742_11875 [Casimicrobiaceae bacterium]|nr:hypothetical protein [Casimicrobiaceae bacterium]
MRVFAWCGMLAVALQARAFTFSDGSTMRCYVRGAPIDEVNAPTSVLHGRIALTERAGASYRILWNEAQLKTLPREMHDYIFFHECAHASVPTQDEVVANCVGLQAMRAAGKAGFAVESKLAAFYGPGSVYWRKTLDCANAFKPSPPPG